MGRRFWLFALWQFVAGQSLEELGMAAQADEYHLTFGDLIGKEKVSTNVALPAASHSPLSSWSRYSCGKGPASQIIPSLRAWLSCRFDRSCCVGPRIS